MIYKKLIIEAKKYDKSLNIGQNYRRYIQLGSCIRAYKDQLKDLTDSISDLF